MPGATTPITPREQAAIVAYKLGFLPDAKTAYFAAEDKPVKEVAKKGINSYVSRWMNSEKIQRFSEYVDRFLADRDADARRRGREEARKGYEDEGRPAESERTETQRGKVVDFYDPANQRRQINRIIAEASDDPKTQLDAIKAIQQTQRDDRQAAQDRRQVQAFLPLRCQNCPLYERAKPKK